MQHVFGERRLWQRCLWLIITLGACITGFSLYSVLRHRHSEQILVSLIDTTQLPVYHIDFPAVAICPWSHVNWQRPRITEDAKTAGNSMKYGRTVENSEGI